MQEIAYQPSLDLEDLTGWSPLYQIPEAKRSKFIDAAFEKHREEIIEEVENQLEFLTDPDYQEIITPESFKRIFETELKKAEQAYKWARAEGHANDNTHDGCGGLTIYFTPDADSVVEDAAQRHNFSDKLEIEDEVRRARIDTGSYSYFKGEISFFMYGPGFVFHLESQDVIRIEADDGSLWQNPNYLWDGLRLAKSQRISTSSTSRV